MRPVQRVYTDRNGRNITMIPGACRDCETPIMIRLGHIRKRCDTCRKAHDERLRRARRAEEKAAIAELTDSEGNIN